MEVSDNGHFNDLIRLIQEESSDREFHWVAESIIQPEFPQIIETLEIVSNLLLFNSPVLPDKSQLSERGPPVKLPVSTPKLEALKGIIVRDGSNISQLSIQLQHRQFNKVIHKLVLKTPIVLKQVLESKAAIDSAIEMIKQSSTLSSCHDHISLIQLFTNLLHKLSIAKNCLQLPTDPSLVFPQNVTEASHFDPPLPPNVAIDVYINQAEVCVDLKYLQQIVEKPWLEIDESGLSYVDKLREEIKLKNPTETQVKIDNKLQSINHGNGLFSNVMSILSQKHEPMDYITKCITYNHSVVMINSKIEVSSLDPIILSAFTKLDSVEYLISRFLENLQDIFK